MRVVITMDNKQRVEAGYDIMAEHYLASKDDNDPETLSALEHLATLVPHGAPVLDLGCGAGVPVTRWLTLHGFAVTGVDISSKQLELARGLVPGATFLKADMASVAFPAESFDAVVSFYAVIHVPRTEQPVLVAHIYDWLKPGGVFLATWALTAWEGEEANWEGWGAPMWWSHYGEDENLDMLREAGFLIESAEPHTGKEQWLWVLARKPGIGGRGPGGGGPKKPPRRQERQDS